MQCLWTLCRCILRLVQLVEGGRAEADGWLRSVESPVAALHALPRVRSHEVKHRTMCSRIVVLPSIGPNGFLQAHLSPFKGTDHSLGKKTAKTGKHEYGFLQLQSQVCSMGSRLLSDFVRNAQGRAQGFESASESCAIPIANLPEVSQSGLAPAAQHSPPPLVNWQTPGQASPCLREVGQEVCFVPAHQYVSILKEIVRHKLYTYTAFNVIVLVQASLTRQLCNSQSRPDIRNGEMPRFIANKHQHKRFVSFKYPS